MCIKLFFYINSIIAMTFVKILNDFGLSDLRKHNKIIDTLLCETTLALELCNLLCGIPLPLLKTGTHFVCLCIVIL